MILPAAKDDRKEEDSHCQSIPCCIELFKENGIKYLKVPNNILSTLKPIRGQQEDINEQILMLKAVLDKAAELTQSVMHRGTEESDMLKVLTNQQHFKTEHTDRSQMVFKQHFTTAG